MLTIKKARITILVQDMIQAKIEMWDADGKIEKIVGEINLDPDHVNNLAACVNRGTDIGEEDALDLIRPALTNPTGESEYDGSAADENTD